MEADSSTHSVVIAAHLWRALEVMARDMAVEPSVLVNQGVFAWLRINGYVAPGTVGQLAKSPPSLAPVTPRPPAAVPVAAPVPREPFRSSLSPTPTVPQGPPKEDAGAAALAGIVARLQEIEGDVNRYVQPRPAWARPAEPAEHEEAEEVDEALVVAVPPPSEDRQLLPPVELADEDVSATGSVPSIMDPEPVEEGTVLLRSNPMVAYVQRDGEPEVRVVSERFIIGRGPQCDVVIDSPRVSREHAAILRLGVTYVLEDLGSSNGTWFNDERVSRRELEGGDVVRLGNELVTFVLRPEG